MEHVGYEEQAYSTGNETGVINYHFDGVFAVDKYSKIIQWNKSAETITGYTQDEMLGNTYSNSILRPLTYQGELLDDSVCSLYTSMSDGIKISENIFIQHKDCFRLPISQRYIPIKNSYGDIEAVYSIMKDNSSKSYSFQRNDDRTLVDSYTGLAKRSFLEVSLSTKFNELRSYSIGFSLILTKVDHLKNIRDHFGDSAADMVIRMTSKTLLQCSRIFDTLGRWGETEIAILVSDATERQLKIIAERFRFLIEKTVFKHNYRVIPVTISCGCAMALDVDSEATLLMRADRLLEQSRLKGGNRISMGG